MTTLAGGYDANSACSPFSIAARAWTDPKPANQVMAKLNKSMDLETFAAAAEAQKPLVGYGGEDKVLPLGLMTAERWQTLIDQLVDLEIVKNPPKAAECFSNAGK